MKNKKEYNRILDELKKEGDDLIDRVVKENPEITPEIIMLSFLFKKIAHMQLEINELKKHC